VSSNQEGATALQVGRIGLIGAVIGALIGGIGSFSGAYITYRQQRDTQVYNLKRAAYVSLLTEAREYNAVLNAMRDAAARDDQAAYVKDYQRLRSESAQELYTAMANVYFVADASVIGKSNAVGTAYFSYTFPPSLKEFDKQAAQKVVEEGVKARDSFGRAARVDLG
jgi:hypothetical protein